MWNTHNHPLEELLLLGMNTANCNDVDSTAVDVDSYVLGHIQVTGIHHHGTVHIQVVAVSYKLLYILGWGHTSPCLLMLGKGSRNGLERVRTG